MLAINGTNRINFNSSSIFNGSKFNIDELGTVHSITADGKLWRGKLNGDATELTLEILNNESILLVLPNIRNSSNRYVISSFDNLIIMDENFSILNSFNLKNKIKNISMFSEYIISSTNNELYILKNNEMIEGFPMETNGYYNIDDIENNNKINIINCKENTVFNYEIEN